MQGGEGLRLFMAGMMLSSSFVVSAISILGCSGGGPVLTITPSRAILLPGQTLQFRVTVDQAPVANLSWFVNGIAGGAASSGTVSSSGLYTAPIASVPTQVQVQASDLAQGGSSAPVTVSFFDPATSSPGQSRLPAIRWWLCTISRRRLAHRWKSSLEPQRTMV